MQESLDTTAIIENYDLYFDGEDKDNASLYVCVARGSAAAGSVIEHLTTAALWSPSSPKMVADDQRQAYKDGLEFVAAQRYRDVDGNELVVTRFDHPRFPSNDERWRAWLASLDTRYQRAD